MLAQRLAGGINMISIILCFVRPIIENEEKQIPVIFIFSDRY